MVPRSAMVPAADSAYPPPYLYEVMEHCIHTANGSDAEFDACLSYQSSGALEKRNGWQWLAALDPVAAIVVFPFLF